MIGIPAGRRSIGGFPMRGRRRSDGHDRSGSNNFVRSGDDGGDPIGVAQVVRTIRA